MNSSTRMIVNNLLRRRLLQQQQQYHSNSTMMLTAKTMIFRSMSVVQSTSPLVTSSSSSSSSSSSPLSFLEHSNPPFSLKSTTTNMNTNSNSNISNITKRWRHSGKVGNRLETLDEMAHRPEREAAQERRQKKKEKKAAKQKKTNKKDSSTAAASQESANVTTTMDDFDDIDNNADDADFDFDDDTGDDNNDDNNDDNDDNLEPTLPDSSLVKEQMTLMIQKFEESLKSIRGAEPTADLFDDLQVNAYGSMTPLKAVGQVVIVSPTLAQITCFDPAVAKDVGKAIQLSMSLNPQVEEGGIVQVPLPRVSMEVREQTAKQLKKKAESCRQKLRKIRRKAMDVVKKGKDGKLAGISKDDAFASGKDIEAVTESAMEMLQGVVDKKMNSIMNI